MKGSAEQSSIVIGSNIRAQRKMKGLSARATAESIGVTMQQMQKYEKGINRISADRLHRLSGVLSVEIDVFFKGLNETDHIDDAAIDHEKLYSLMKAYSNIKNEKLREQVIELARGFSRID